MGGVGRLRARFGKLALISIGSALAAAWALNVIWWWLLPIVEDPAETVDLVIPEGTARIVLAGETVSLIPSAFELAPGSRLRVVNNDIVEHQIAGSAIPPGAKATIEVPADGSDLVCTIHPAGYIGLTLTTRPHIAATALPSVLLGLPLGILLLTVLAITRSINWGDDDRVSARA